MVFEIVHTSSDSIIISNGNTIKGWDFSDEEITPPSQEKFEEYKNVFTCEKVSYESFELAKEAYKKHWAMIMYKNAPMYRLNRVLE